MLIKSNNSHKRKQEWKATDNKNRHYLVYKSKKPNSETSILKVIIMIKSHKEHKERGNREWDKKDNLEDNRGNSRKQQSQYLRKETENALLIQVITLALEVNPVH